MQQQTKLEGADAASLLSLAAATQGQGGQDAATINAIQTILQAATILQLAANPTQPSSGPSLAAAPPTRSAPVQRRAQAASPSLSGSQNDDADADMADGATPTGGNSLSAKEKNRQAQRRFRERQKNLIATLRKKCDELAAQVASQEKQVALLKEENALLRAKDASRQMPAVQITAADLQSALAHLQSSKAGAAPQLDG